MSDAAFEPRPEGASGHSRQEPDAASGPPNPETRFTRVGRLADLLEEWRFFTCGPVWSIPGIRINPISDYVNHARRNVRVGDVKLEKPVFSGLIGNSKFDCNHALHICHVDDWDDLHLFIQNVAFQDNDRRNFYRTFSHETRVPDVLALDKCEQLPNPVPTVPVFVIGVASLHQVWFLPPRPEAEAHLPVEFCRRAPNGDDKLMALCALAGHPIQAAKVRLPDLRKPPKAAPPSRAWLDKMRRQFGIR